MLKKYVEESGIEAAFQLISMEVVSEEIPEEEIFKYTARRLREIGKDFKKIEQGIDLDPPKPTPEYRSFATRKASVKKKQE